MTNAARRIGQRVVAPLAPGRGRHGRAAIPLLLYLGLSLALIGRPVLADFGSRTIGFGADPTLFAWSMEWWPHAFLNGLDPIHPDIIYAPDGFNLTWATSVPILSIGLSPITALAGPIAAYNLLAVLIPALNGWAAFLLCRALGARFWPSVAGGYVFGFSTYVLGHSLGHPNLSLVAAIPLSVFLFLQHLQGRIGSRGFVAALASTLIFQFLTSTEVFLTMTSFGLVTLGLAALIYPNQRRRLLGAARLVLAAYAIAGAVVSPYLYAFLTDRPTLTHADPFVFSADPLNVIVPTQLTAVGGETFRPIGERFSGNMAENGAYLGLPLLLVVVLFARDRVRGQGARLLLMVFGVGIVAALGPRLNVLGDQTAVVLPWSPFVELPLFKYVLPARLVVYAWLALAGMVALWLSAHAGKSWRRWALVGLGAVSLLPNLWVRNEALDVSIWSIHRPVPEFFRDARLRDRLGPDPNLLVLPYNEAGNGNALLWQAESGMSFSMPGGNVSATIPPEFTCWPIVGSLIAGIYSQGQVGYLRSFLKGKEVDAVVVPVEESPPLTPLLDGLPVRRWKSGGVYVYDLPRTSSDRAAACPG